MEACQWRGVFPTRSGHSWSLPLMDKFWSTQFWSRAGCIVADGSRSFHRWCWWNAGSEVWCLMDKWSGWSHGVAGDSRLDKSAWMTQSHFQMRFKGLQWNLSVRFTGPDADFYTSKSAQKHWSLCPSASCFASISRSLLPQHRQQSFCGRKGSGPRLFFVVFFLKVPWDPCISKIFPRIHSLNLNWPLVKVTHW